MKIILTEDKVEKFSNFLERTINEMVNIDDVCNIKVYYDEQFDKFVFNIFFSRKRAIELGASLNARQNKIINYIGVKISSVLGVEPFMYIHYEDC